MISHVCIPLYIYNLWFAQRVFPKINEHFGNNMKTM